MTVKDVLKYMAHMENSDVSESGEVVGQLLNFLMRIFEQSRPLGAYMRLSSQSPGDEAHELNGRP